MTSVRTAWDIRLKKVLIRSNGLGYPFEKSCHPFERLGISVWKNCYPFERHGLSVRKRICRPFQRLKLSVQRSILALFPSQNHFVASHSRRTICNLRSGSIFVSLWKLHSGGHGETKREPDTAWYKPSTKRLPPTFLIDLHLPNQPTKITSVACFSSMQIFHAWEKCRLANLKNSFYLLIFSAKNKTVSTIAFNFLRD